MNDEEHDRQTWGIAMSHMSDTQLSERLQELREVLQIMRAQEQDTQAQIGAEIVEQKRRRQTN